MKGMSVGESLFVFHDAFKCSRKKKYKNATVEDAELLVLRKNLIREEVNELFEAINNEPAENVLKELVDVVVVCVGMADTYGWDFDSVFRADGKVLKSKNYKPAELIDLV
jgi:NTP pyrophosphatase (non-canonical NTP hydrolase)